MSNDLEYHKIYPFPPPLASVSFLMPFVRSGLFGQLNVREEKAKSDLGLVTLSRGGSHFLVVNPSSHSRYHLSRLFLVRKLLKETNFSDPFFDKIDNQS